MSQPQRTLQPLSAVRSHERTLKAVFHAKDCPRAAVILVTGALRGSALRPGYDKKKWFRIICKRVSQIAKKRPLASSCLASRMKRFGSSWTNFHEIWHFFLNMLRKFRFDWNLTRRTGTLHEDLYTYMFIPVWVLLRLRNVSDENVTENQSTNFSLNNFYPKIVPFLR